MGLDSSEKKGISKDKVEKLCIFDDLFFCENCIKDDFCVDCYNILTIEERELLKNKL